MNGVYEGVLVESEVNGCSGILRMGANIMTGFPSLQLIVCMCVHVCVCVCVCMCVCACVCVLL